MKLFFLYTVPQSNSIYKKVRDQISTFNKLTNNKLIDGFDCVESSYTKNYRYSVIVNNHKVNFYEKPGHIYALSNVVFSYPRLYKHVIDYLIKNGFTHIYIRRAVCDVFLIRFLRRLKRSGIKVIFEIPTYPYDKEFPPNSIYKKIDNKWRNKLHLYVNRVVTPFRGYEEIFGIPVITVDNGIIVENVKKVDYKKSESDGSTINLIAVAGLSYWHGYDRLLKGLISYYSSNDNPINIVFHLVGGDNDNPYRKEYERIVNGSCIEGKVVFYGPLFGDDLNSIYDKADIAISSLGLHRLGLSQSATLKSREYLAKGLPIISEGNVGYDSMDFKYAFSVPMDESSICIQDIINFYDKIYLNNLDSRKQVVNEIVDYAYKNFDMYELMKNMINEMN